MAKHKKRKSYREHKSVIDYKEAGRILSTKGRGGVFEGRKLRLTEQTINYIKDNPNDVTTLTALKERSIGFLERSSTLPNPKRKLSTVEEIEANRILEEYGRARAELAQLAYNPELTKNTTLLARRYNKVVSLSEAYRKGINSKKSESWLSQRAYGKISGVLGNIRSFVESDTINISPENLEELLNYASEFSPDRYSRIIQAYSDFIELGLGSDQIVQELLSLGEEFENYMNMDGYDEGQIDDIPDDILNIMYDSGLM